MIAVVNVMWRLWQVRIVRGIVPTTDQVTIGVHPVKAIRDHLYLSLHLVNVFEEFQQVSVGQHQACTQVSVVQGSPFAPDDEPADEGIGNEPGLYVSVILNDGGHAVAFSRAIRSLRRSAI